MGDDKKRYHYDFPAVMLNPGWAVSCFKQVMVTDWYSVYTAASLTIQIRCVKIKKKCGSIPLSISYSFSLCIHTRPPKSQQNPHYVLTYWVCPLFFFNLHKTQLVNRTCNRFQEWMNSCSLEPFLWVHYQQYQSAAGPRVVHHTNNK